MIYLAFIHKEPKTDYWVSFPDLPGCFSSGETVEEAKENAKDATKLYMESLEKQGLKVPKPRSDEEILKTEELPPQGYIIHHVYVETEDDYS